MNEFIRGIPRKLLEEGVKFPDQTSEKQTHEEKQWRELLVSFGRPKVQKLNF